MKESSIDDTALVSDQKKEEEEMDEKKKATNPQPAKTLKLKRFFTKELENPFDSVEWITSRVSINDLDGNNIFDHEVEHPTTWDEMAVRICADKYFKTHNLENHPSGGERSIKDVIHRVAYSISHRGHQMEYFDEESREVLYDELCYIMIHQYAAFNSPVFFNWGLYDVYEFAGNSKAERWAFKDREGQLYKQQHEYENPQGSACFIAEVNDELINGETGIYDWINLEMRIFANGSGCGLNVSRIRGEGESITGGGKSSGLMSFLEPADSSAGVIKSGGKTRRAAKMLILDDTHPDLLEFINWKKEEEFKARTLILNGYMQKYTDKDSAYKTVQAQNANNSVAITDDFMNAVINDEDWELKYVLDGKTKNKVKARDIFDQMVEAAWECGDPGMFYIDTINEWNTIPNTGKIRSSNPCGEFLQPDNSSCNLASINLVRLLKDDKTFDVESFAAIIEYYITAMEIVIAGSSYPSKRIAEMTRNTRPLGLGYCNMGGFIMKLGYPYDSDQARMIISTITSLESALAYRQSSKIAAVVGPFLDYGKNKNEFGKIIKKHVEATAELKPRFKLVKQLHQAATEVWDETEKLIQKHGVRNSQVVVIAPTGTIMFLMGTTNNGIEPPFSLTSYKLMSDGSMVTLMCKETHDALRDLGYNEAQVDEIGQYINKVGHVEGAPYLNVQHYPIFDTANVNGGGKRFIRPMAHVEAIAAATPFISGGISKTINMPDTATPEDIWDCYVEGWKMGCKSLALYRSGSKWSQPLNSRNKKIRKETIQRESKRARQRIEQSDFHRENPNDIWEYRKGLAARKRAGGRAPSERLNFQIGGENIHFHPVRYPDNGISELWIEVGKENPTVNGLADAIGRIVSVAIQYGVPIEALADTMSNLQFDPAGFLGPNDLEIHSAESLADLTAKVLKKLTLEYESEDSDGLIEYNQPKVSGNGGPSISSSEEAKTRGFSGVQCEECGSW